MLALQRYYHGIFANILVPAIELTIICSPQKTVVKNDLKFRYENKN